MLVTPYTNFFKEPYNEFNPDFAEGGQAIVWRTGSTYYMSHVFTSGSDTTFTIYTSSLDVSLLIVGGGGSAGIPQKLTGGYGTYVAGTAGGGGGGVNYTSSLVLNLGRYYISVGNGGISGSSGNTSTVTTLLTSSHFPKSASGGGYGGGVVGTSYPFGMVGGNGGSGGGGLGTFGGGHVSGGIGSMGNNGGVSYDIYGGGGGGGGYTSIGGNANLGGIGGGNGGNGLSNNILDGITRYYGAGGGGGLPYNGALTGSAGTGGSGGFGGNGGAMDQSGSDGYPNTGGGGGGAGGSSDPDVVYKAGSGANGTVIFTYQLPVTKILTGSVNPYSSSYFTSSFNDPGLFIAGRWSSVNGTSSVYVTKLKLSDGTVDTSYSSGRSTGVIGDLIVSVYSYNGYVYSYGAASGYDSWRQNFSGSIDYNFNPVGAIGRNALYAYSNYVVVQSGSMVSSSFNDPRKVDLFVYGEYNSYNGNQAGSIYNLTKLQKTSYDYNDLSLNWSSSLALITGSIGNIGSFITQPQQQNDGKIIVVGWPIFGANGIKSEGILRLNAASGTLDTSYNTGGGFSGSFRGGVHSDPYLFFAFDCLDKTTNEMYVAFATSSVTHYSGSSITKRVIRIKSDGTLDTTYPSGSGFSVKPENLVVQPDGKVIYFLPESGSYNGTSITGSVRLNYDGTIDATWVSTGSVSTITKAQVYDNKVYVLTTDYGSVGNDNKFYRYDMTGSADPSWTITTIAGDNNSTPAPPPLPPFQGGKPMFSDFSIG